MNATGPLMVPVGTPRRVFVIALVLGGITLAGASVLGRPAVGGLFLVGLLIGGLNNVMTVRSILKHTERGDADKKQFAKASLVRLLYMTLLAGVFVIAFRPEGIAVLVGLAIFHLLAGLATTVPVLKEFRKA